MKSLLKRDLGRSIRTKRPVIKDISQFLPATIELTFFSMLFASIFGILFGIISATKQNSAIDHICRTISVTGVSIPMFWFGLIMLYVFYYKLGWAFGPGRISSSIELPSSIKNFYIFESILQGNWVVAADSFRHIILPSIVLASFNMGLISRTTRANLLEVLSTDYIRTAKAKGLSNRLIVMRHALGNALIPVITVMGLGLSKMLGGTVLVENIFAWPGIGEYAYQSVIGLDFAAITAVSLLVAITYLFVFLFIDILYGVIDPRVRYI
jgi:peptide/nickel transport system permease protein